MVRGQSLVRHLSLLTLLAAAALLVSPATAAPVGVDFSSEWGLRTATFELPTGTVRVHMPNVLAPGDAFSLRIEVEGEHLESFRIRFADSEANVADGHIDGFIGGQHAGAPVALVLAGPAGAELERVEVPLARRAPEPPVEFRTPHLGHAGSPVVIYGPFDGDLGTGEVQIGGQPARKLAESSRSLIVESPAAALGPVGLVLSDPGYAGRFEFRALRIDVEAPRVSIGEGEEIALRAHVAGLEGLDEELPLLAVNRTPEVVAMGGEESRGTMRHLVRPAQVAADGSYTFELPVTGRSHGDFEILVAALQKVDKDASIHVVNVTNPPHYAPVTNPDEHATNVTWPEVHADNVTFPDHTANVTWPPEHYANITWAEHATHITDWLPPTDPDTGEEEEEPVEGEVEEGEAEGTGSR